MSMEKNLRDKVIAMNTESDQDSFPSSPDQVTLLLIKQGKPFIFSH